MVTETIIESDENAAGILTLAHAKQQLRIEESFTDEDELIEVYIKAAQSAASNFIGRAIGARTFIMQCNTFELLVRFEGSSNDKIQKVEYYKPGETELTVLDPEKYHFKKSSVIDCFDVKFYAPLLETAERDDAVIITIDQGYDADSCPAAIKQAMLLMLSDYYERREDRGEIGYNSAANSLLRPYRKY